MPTHCYYIVTPHSPTNIQIICPKITSIQAIIKQDIENNKTGHRVYVQLDLIFQMYMNISKPLQYRI